MRKLFTFSRFYYFADATHRVTYSVVFMRSADRVICSHHVTVCFLVQMSMNVQSSPIFVVTVACVSTRQARTNAIVLLGYPSMSQPPNVSVRIIPSLMCRSFWYPYSLTELVLRCPPRDVLWEVYSRPVLGAVLETLQRNAMLLHSWEGLGRDLFAVPATLLQ